MRPVLLVHSRSTPLGPALLGTAPISDAQTLSQQLSKWFGGSNPSEKERTVGGVGQSQRGVSEESVD